MVLVPNGGGIELDNNHLQYNKENISFDKPTTLPQHIYTHTHNGVTPHIIIVDFKGILSWIIRVN